MFGFLCPIRAEVSAADAGVFAAHEGAVGAALRVGFGAGSGTLATPDAAFVSVLCAAQRPGRQTPRPRDAGVRLAAAVAVVLAYRKVEDDVADEPTRLVRVAERWLRGKRERARRVVAALGFDLTESDAAFADQVDVEAENTAPLATMAAATGRGMAALLAHTGRLAGVEQNVEPLRDLGAALGELIFAVDAVHDLAHDARVGLSNPLIDGGRPGRAPRQEDFRAARATARTFVSPRLRSISGHLRAVRLVRHEPLVAHILTKAVPRRVDCILAGGDGLADISWAGPRRPWRVIRRPAQGE